jgi:O-antigen/teichoic acid export membrane protein
VGSIAAGAYALAINYRRPLWKLSYLRIGLFLSVPFVFHQLSGWILDLSDRVLIARYLGVEAVARYHVAYTIASIIVILLTSVNSAWAPHYYGTMTEVAKGRVPGSLVLPLNILCAAASLFLVTASPILLRLAAPKAFGSAVFVLAVVAGAASMRATYYLATVVLFDKKDSVSIAKSSGAAAIGNIVLNVLFLKHFGIIVSGVSTSLCMALMALFIMRKAEKKSSLHFPTARLIGIWVSSTAVLVAVAAIPMAGSTWLLRLGLGMFALIVMWLAGIRARDNYRAAIA